MTLFKMYGGLAAVALFLKGCIGDKYAAEV